MGQTKYYNMSYFDFGDQLNTGINVQKEIDRFVLIDEQMYGLYNVFGNGVISGWTVTDAGFTAENGISVAISQGIGVIKYLASETNLPGSINNLSPNSVIDIYAVLTGNTRFDRIINFIASTTLVTGNNVIRIARVGTGANTVLYIDNDVRDKIGFQEIIQDAIDAHHHRGTPSKIDLQEEIKNQLPGARIEGIDASKIVSGLFDIDRIPFIDHNDLKNNGLLTHAALDSFVRTFSQNNKELLGEVASVNLIKTIIFLKYLYSEVDEHSVNELALIPGVSPNNFIDFNASTANINLVDKCISGYLAQSGLFTSVYWNNTFSFNTYYYKENILIENNTVSLDRSSSNIDIVADFSDGLIGFETETISTDDSGAAVTWDSEGNRLGRLTSGSTSTYYYRKNLATAKNWAGTYDELVIKVQTDDQIHEPVYMYVVNGSNISTEDGNSYGSIETGDITGEKEPSSSWVLLEANEYMSTLTEKTFDISNLDLDEVTQIVIYTEDSDITFDIDDIWARRTNLVSSSGSIRFRYQTDANVVFHSIFYDTTIPDDTNLEVKIKTSSSVSGLATAGQTYALSNGDVVALTGSAIEIEVSMDSNTEQTLSPTLTSLELRMLVDADFTGFVIDTYDEWARGTLVNVETEGTVVGSSVQTDVIVSTPINVGGRYFTKSSSVSEINDAKVGVLGFSGNLMPVSTNQARNWSVTSSRGFNFASSVIRKYSKNFLIADTHNNRVLEVDKDGNLVKGFASTYIKDDDNFYPLTSCYNSNTQVLTTVFTKPPVVADITKIALYIGSLKVSLTEDDTVVVESKGGGKVLEILLSDEMAVRLASVTDNLSVNFDAGAFNEIITVSDGMKSQGNSIYSDLRGVICFIGNLTYINNISHPIFINETEDGNWIVCNSSIFYGEIDSNKEETHSVPDIVEINPDDLIDTDDKLSSTDIKFSDFSLGSIYEYESGRFIVAGIEETVSSITSNGDALLAKYQAKTDVDGNLISVPDNVYFRSEAMTALTNYRGSVRVIDKANNRSSIFYTSPDGIYPSDLDVYSNGDILIAESSFADASGRLIKMDAYGNITWNYGSGTFNMINDAKVLNDDKIIVSV